MRMITIMAVVLAPIAAGGAAAGEVIARVGTEIITRTDVEQLVREELAPYYEARRKAEELGQWRPADEAQFHELETRAERRARAELLRRAVVKDYARTVKFKPSDLDVELQFENRAQAAGGVAELERATGMSADRIREQLRLTEYNRNFFTKNAPIPMPPSPSEVRRYFEENRDQFRPPMQVRVRLLYLPAGPDEEEARYQAEAIRRELQFDPSRFEMRADDFAGADGDLGPGGLLMFTDPQTGRKSEWIPANLLSPALAQVITGLRPGSVSNLIHSGESYVIVKLDGMRQPEAPDFRSVAAEVANGLRRMEEMNVFNQWVEHYLERSLLLDGRGRPLSIERFLEGY